jgi:hypothetical protein
MIIFFLFFAITHSKGYHQKRRRFFEITRRMATVEGEKSYIESTI